MASEREMKEKQEDRLYEYYFAQEILNKGKPDIYKAYAVTMSEKAKNGMTADEVDAVKERAKNAAISHLSQFNQLFHDRYLGTNWNRLSWQEFTAKVEAGEFHVFALSITQGLEEIISAINLKGGIFIVSKKNTILDEIMEYEEQTPSSANEDRRITAHDDVIVCVAKSTGGSALCGFCLCFAYMLCCDSGGPDAGTCLNPSECYVHWCTEYNPRTGQQRDYGGELCEICCDIRRACCCCECLTICWEDCWQGCIYLFRYGECDL